MAKTNNLNNNSENTSPKIIQTAKQIAVILRNNYPNPKTELIHSNEFQMFVAVCLSAQTTDKKVNQITPKLFEKYQSFNDLEKARLGELQKDIHGVNFHKGKADRLIKAAKFINQEFQGKLPKTIVELIKIPGIARKSANVLLQELWNIAEGIVVDTHVTRVSNRLELTRHKDAVKIENDLMQSIPSEYWRNYSGAVVSHGRYICTARKPKCAICVLNKICPSAFVTN